MQAIRMHQTGGPEVFALETLPDPAPAPGEVLIDVEAVGVNFIDCYHRSGLYPQPLPFTPGVEGAGTVCALGTGVTDWQIGDRVAWAGVPGSYAERIVNDLICHKALIILAVLTGGNHSVSYYSGSVPLRRPSPASNSTILLCEARSIDVDSELSSLLVSRELIEVGELIQEGMVCCCSHVTPSRL